MTRRSPKTLRNDDKRKLSLFNQGQCWYRALPNMPDGRARMLLGAFESPINQHEYFVAIFAAI